MSSINESVQKVRVNLFNPKEQKPSVEQIFHKLLYNYQNFCNELENTGQVWTYDSVDVTVSNNVTDYRVPRGGKVLFVVAYPSNTAYVPYSMEFCDLAEVSGDFFLYSPLDFALGRDFGEGGWYLPYPYKVAFYRKNGDLWLRLAPYNYNLTSIKVTFATGNWTENISTEASAVLSNHHQLVEVRASIDLLPGTEWKEEDNYNFSMRQQLASSLSNEEARYKAVFDVAKRSLTMDQVNTRDAYGDWY